MTDISSREIDGRLAHYIRCINKYIQQYMISILLHNDIRVCGCDSGTAIIRQLCYILYLYYSTLL